MAGRKVNLHSTSLDKAWQALKIFKEVQCQQYVLKLHAWPYRNKAEVFLINPKINCIWIEWISELIQRKFLLHYIQLSAPVLSLYIPSMNSIDPDDLFWTHISNTCISLCSCTRTVKIKRNYFLIRPNVRRNFRKSPIIKRLGVNYALVRPVSSITEHSDLTDWYRRLIKMRLPLHISLVSLQYVRQS